MNISNQTNKRKERAMTNKEIAELMFSKMRKFGFTPYDIDYGNGYFLFEMGENSVVHFRIKEVWKNWKFGMWINSEALEYYKGDDETKHCTSYEDEPNVVQLFCQHEHLLDKFKPSRSALCVNYKPTDFTYGWSDYLIGDMLKMIKYHPIMCWNEFCGDHADYYDRRSFLFPFLGYETKYLLGELNKKIKTVFWLNYTKAKLFLMKKFSKVLYDVELYDFEKENEGWSTDYLYEIKLTFNDVGGDKICKFYDFWFKRAKYGKFDTWDWVIELASRFHVKDDEQTYWVDFDKKEIFYGR
jgi:hypothetical protein